MTKLLAVCVLMLYMATAKGSLKCHQCISTKGWDDCTKDQKEVTCLIGQNRCAVAIGRVSSGTVYYTKGCTTESQCLADGSGLCKGTVDCHGSCCDGNLCNKAEAPVPTPTPTPVKCYQCASNKSWDDCDQTQQVVTCPTNAQSCAKVVLEGKRGDQSVKAYGKVCIKSSKCDQDGCKFEFRDESVTTTKCNLECCTSDLCNGAKVPMISAIILWACALVVVLR